LVPALLAELDAVGAVASVEIAVVPAIEREADHAAKLKLVKTLTSSRPPR